MRIAVFGVGAVGGYFGARLAQAGFETVFIARGEHLRAIQQNGLQLESIKGDVTVRPSLAVERAEQAGPVDLVLVAVKTWAVPQAAEAMRPLVGHQTVVLPLLNGVEAPDQLAAVLGKEHVLGGLCQISTEIAGPGHIRHVGIDPLIIFGELDGGAPSSRVAQVRRVLEQAAIRVDTPPDVLAAMWRKFLFIAPFGGVGAVTRASAGVLRAVPETRAMLLEAIQEVAAVAHARGVKLAEDAAQATLAFVDGLAPGIMASMQKDILAGRPSELEAQNGAVVRMGRAAGVPTPVNAFIYHALLPQEKQARGEMN